MYRYHHRKSVWSLCLGVLVVACLGGLNLAETHEARSQVGSVCHGFVVLPNGYAVLSGMPMAPMHGGGHAQHSGTQQEAAMGHQGHGQMQPKPMAEMAHGHMSSQPQQMAQMDHGHTGHMNKPADASEHLMGLQHGQEITLKPGMLCVPINGKDDTTWMAVSSEPSLRVMADSLKGPLSHNSRTNESLALTVMRRGTDMSMQPLHVRMLARMPHHDRQMPGGHGLANDPDVQGLDTQRDDLGRYNVPTVDFPMAGAWLFEVQVQQGEDTLRAYFATEIGEQ